ncbi:MAG: class I SAM-dependent methyltransferase [Clostridia bacterium]|nr:class I SAM-dependent methyltransferase [Clostridia bacterium]
MYTKLSDRLMMIAEETEKGQIVADIGTDHGFLPLFLIESGIAPKAILADISKGSLEKARQNVENYIQSCPQEERTCLRKCFDFRLGDGLSVIAESEADTVVIAGMGGILMAQILLADLRKTFSFKRLILQPRNKAGHLMHILEKNGIKVEKEQLVREGRFICEIITAYPEAFPDRTYFSEEFPGFEYEAGERLFRENPHEIASQYVLNRLRIHKEITDSIVSGKSSDSESLGHSQAAIEYLEGLLKRYGQ